MPVEHDRESVPPQSSSSHRPILSKLRTSFGPPSTSTGHNPHPQSAGAGPGPSSYAAGRRISSGSNSIAAKRRTAGSASPSPSHGPGQGPGLPLMASADSSYGHANGSASSHSGSVGSRIWKTKVRRTAVFKTGIVALACLLGWVLLGKWARSRTGPPASELLKNIRIPEARRYSHRLPDIILPPNTTSPLPNVAVALLHPSRRPSPRIASIISSFLTQTHPPQDIVILAPLPVIQELQSTHSSVIRPPVRVEAYDSSGRGESADHLEALLELSKTSLSDPYTYVVPLSEIDERLVPRSARDLETLLTAAAMPEYRASWLSSEGLHFSRARTTWATCRIAATSTAPMSLFDQGQSHEDTTRGGWKLTDYSGKAHVPTNAFLVQTSHLAAVQVQEGGSNLPVGASIALELWGHGSVGGYVVPLELGREEDVEETVKASGLLACDRVKQALDLDVDSDGDLVSTFLGPAGTMGDESSRPAWTRGSISFFVSGGTELDERGEQSEWTLMRPLACALGRANAVTVWIAGQAEDEWPAVDNGCPIAVVPFDPTAFKEGATDVAFYLRGGRRESLVRTLLQNAGASFGPHEGEASLTAIGVPAHDLPHIPWVSALPIEALKNWHKPRVDVTVITNNRPESLQRLLRSLSSAHYLGDQVNLFLNLEQTADRTTQAVVDTFLWQHGPTSVRRRIIVGGVIAAVVESWYPTGNDNYGVLLEDDIEVSPMFYAWLKFTILYYRYYPPARAQSSRLFGISLYQQKNNELVLGRRPPFDAHEMFEGLSLHPDIPYLSQIPCSWGAAYFPEQWREFHDYLALRLSEVTMEIADEIVPEVKSNRWARSWKRYFIELVYLRGYVMLYPNFSNFSSLSTNHLEQGAHNKRPIELKTKMKFWVPLMEHGNKLLGLPDGRLPDWSSMPVLDLWGGVATDNELVGRGWETVQLIGSCPTYDAKNLPSFEARELLCPREYERRVYFAEGEEDLVL